MKILKFYSKTCGPCKIMGNHLNKVTSIPVEEIDIMDDLNEEIIQKYNIRSIPTIIIINEDKIIKEFKGVIPENTFLKELNEIIKYYE